ncbi:MAG: cohesin domain-containing protein, partial [Patescibacteria group bacterium]
MKYIKLKFSFITSIKLSILFISFFLLSVTSALAADISIAPSNTAVSPNTQFTVSINISAVSNLFGAAFDLIFDPAILQFVSAQKGTFLEQDGVSTNLLTAVSPPGDLIIGYSRLASNGVATGISGSGVLMTLTFNALSAGASNLTFQNNSLCDASNPSG